MSTITPPPQTLAPSGQEKNLSVRLLPIDWLILAAVLALFLPMFLEMVKIWSLPDAPQSYGLLILPAAAGLAWMLRGRLANLTPTPSPVGLAPLLLGIGALLVGTLATAVTISGVGFVLVVTGVVWLRYGGEVTARLWFPLAYLLAMVPFPSEILNLMTFPLQKLSIQWAALILKPFGDVVVDGTQMRVGGFALNVIAPCSGLTIVLPLLVLAIYYLYIIDAPLWKKALLALLTFPVAMAVNAVRVALIGVVGESFGQRAADQFHDYSGILTVVLGFMVLIFLAREIKCDRLSEDIAL